MAETSSRSGKRQQSIRGLATLALLKANYDAGRDHIGMFVPLLADVIAALKKDDFSLEDAKDLFYQRHGLLIPSPALQTLLNRMKGHGIHREGGQYFRDLSQLGQADITEAKAKVRREQSTLANALLDFAQLQGISLSDEEESLLLLLDFLGEHQFPMLLQAPVALSVSAESPLPARQEKMVARFVLDKCLKDPHLAEYLNNMMEGYVLQNALLLKDISTVTRRFRELTVYFDTGFLLGALGLEGKAQALVAKDVMAVVGTAGARLAVFRSTIEEIRAILRAHEHGLATPQARMGLNPTEVARYFITNHYQPSDVRQVAALLDLNIRYLGLDIKELPLHERLYTLDEKALSTRMARPGETSIVPRVMHDVHCVAAILTLRRGAGPETLDDAKAVFATTSGSVLKAVVGWFREQGGKGMPPIMHYRAVANIAWLKKPASASMLKLHELVALCQSALRPSRELWSRFLLHLRVLEQVGTLTSEEAVAIVASELTDVGLGEAEEELGEVDAASLTEVVERVKTSYQADAHQRIAQAEARAGEAVENRRQTVLRVESRAAITARILSSIFFYGLASLLSVALGLSVPGVIPWFGSWWGTVVGVLAGLVVGTITFCRVAYGTHPRGLRGLRDLFEMSVRCRLSAWLLGEAK